MMKFNKLLLASTLSALVISAGVQAGETGHSQNHGDEAKSQATDNSMSQGSMSHGSMSHGSMSNQSMDSGMAQSEMFLEKKDIDGYTVSFHVMPAQEGMGHGGSYNLMIKVEQQGVVVSGYQANSKVVYPDGTEESKPLMAMGDWQMVGYDLKANGQHQLMVLFKTADGKKHFGGVHYGK